MVYNFNLMQFSHFYHLALSSFLYVEPDKTKPHTPFILVFFFPHIIPYMLDRGILGNK